MEIKKGNLKSRLKELILAYKMSHPRLSSAQVAKRFKISTSTFHRFERGEIENPNFEAVLKILLASKSSSLEIFDFLTLYYPEFHHFVTGLMYKLKDLSLGPQSE